MNKLIRMGILGKVKTVVGCSRLIRIPFFICFFLSFSFVLDPCQKLFPYKKDKSLESTGSLSRFEIQDSRTNINVQQFPGFWRISLCFVFSMCQLSVSCSLSFGSFFLFIRTRIGSRKLNDLNFFIL